MNETQYVEAAQHLAKRCMAASEPTNAEDRIQWLFETVTARLPSETEALELNQLLGDLRLYYAEHPDLSAKLGTTSESGGAAWTILASTVLNLDEVVSK